MDHLYPMHLKIVATGGNLTTAAEMLLTEKSPAEVNVEDVELAHLLSDDVNPEDFVAIGTTSLIKAVLAAATPEIIQNYLFGGTYATSVLTKPQGIRTLTKIDARLSVKRVNGNTAQFDFTKMTLAPKLAMPFQQKERFYLPVEIRSMRGHIFSWSVV